MSIKKAKVSLFRNYRDPIPLRSIYLVDFLTKSNSKLRKSVDIIRSSSCDNTVRRLKSKLPAITVSGVFKARKKSELISHSGFICIDIDNVIDINSIKTSLIKDEYIAYMGVSVSGNGLFVVIQIENENNHEEHFDSLLDYFKSKHNIDIDRACRDVSRLRGYSIDDNFYLNPKASVYCHKKNRNVIPPRPNYTSNNLDHSRFMTLLDLINKTGEDITQHRDDWVKIGYAIAGTYGETGRAYFHEISKNYNDYSTRETDREYNSYLRGSSNCSISTIFYIAKRYNLTLN